jgi:hypothetical protein
MVWSDMSKPALIFFFTASVHTTKSSVKISPKEILGYYKLE